MDARLVLLVAGLAVVHAQYTAPKCNPTVVAGIEKYWADHGKPTEFFSQKDVIWTVVKNTDSKVYGDAKCVTYTPLGSGVLSVQIDHANFKNITATQKDGFLTVSGDKDLHYLAIGTNKLTAAYRCNPNGPVESATVQPDAAILASPAAIKTDITSAVSFFTGLGLKMTKSYAACLTLDE